MQHKTEKFNENVKIGIKFNPFVMIVASLTMRKIWITCPGFAGENRP